MTRFLRAGLIAAAALAIVSTGAMANIPDPGLSVVPDFITITPDGNFDVVLVINGQLGPVQGAVVTIQFSPDATRLVAWSDPVQNGDVPSHLECTAEPYRTYTSVADVNGEAHFHIAGGACIEDAPYAAANGTLYITHIEADHVPMKESQVNSPDVVDGSGNKCTYTQINPNGVSTCDINGVSTVSANDGAYHAPQFKNGLVDVCSDFTSPYGDGGSGADASIAADYIKNSKSLTCHVMGVCP
jgi:hypothetical protein